MSRKPIKKRLTLEQAEKLYPNEWVVFSEPNVDRSNTSFVDGVVYWHGTDSAESFRKAAEIRGDCARLYAGVIPYRKITLCEEHASSKKVA